jgi:hypothetical protein
MLPPPPRLPRPSLRVCRHSGWHLWPLVSPSISPPVLLLVPLRVTTGLPEGRLPAAVSGVPACRLFAGSASPVDVPVGVPMLDAATCGFSVRACNAGVSSTCVGCCFASASAWSSSAPQCSIDRSNGVLGELLQPYFSIGDMGELLQPYFWMAKCDAPVAANKATACFPHKKLGRLRLPRRNPRKRRSCVYRKRRSSKHGKRRSTVCPWKRRSLVNLCQLRKRESRKRRCRKRRSRKRGSWKRRSWKRGSLVSPL